MHLIPQVGVVEGEGSAIFAFVKATEMVDGQDSVLLALTHLGHVFETRALNVDELVSSLSIREVSADRVFYDFKRQKKLALAGYDEWQSFDLQVGDGEQELAVVAPPADVVLVVELPVHVDEEVGFTFVVRQVANERHHRPFVPDQPFNFLGSPLTENHVPVGQVAVDERVGVGQADAG